MAGTFGQPGVTFGQSGATFGSWGATETGRGGVRYAVPPTRRMVGASGRLLVTFLISGRPVALPVLVGDIVGVRAAGALRHSVGFAGRGHPLLGMSLHLSQHTAVRTRHRQEIDTTFRIEQQSVNDPDLWLALDLIELS